MGYNTRYTFTTIEAPDLNAFRSALSDIAGVDPVTCNDEMNWYDHQGQIKAAMEASGASVVVLHGEGEDQGDVWDREFRFMDGRVDVKEYRYKLVREEQPT